MQKALIILNYYNWILSRASVSSDSSGAINRSVNSNFASIYFDTTTSANEAIIVLTKKKTLNKESDYGPLEN